MVSASFVTAMVPALLQGAYMTLFIAACSTIIGLILGTFLAIIHTSSIPWLSWPVTVYVTIMRGTPMLIQIPFFYYVFPTIGLNFSALTTAIIAIGLNSAAYISQIVRSGISSIAKGQWEASKVLGLSSWQTLRFVILPQALAVIVPALLSECITLIKDSSLASTIGVVELFKAGTIIISRTYNALPVYAGIASIYLLLTMSLSMLANWVDKRMRRHVSH